MYAPVVFLKPIRDSSVFRPKRPKNPTLRGNTYLYNMAYIREYPPSQVLTPFMIVHIDQD